MKSIPVYKFSRFKYGAELLIDVIDYDRIRDGVRVTPVFSESFYSVTLVLEGDDEVSVNGQSLRVRRGMVICSIPGEVWTFGEEPKMDALNLIFEKEFLLSFFIDPHFLDQFGYLQSDRSSPFLQADEATLQRLLTLYREMRAEITDHEQKDHHILRAMLYETLMLLSRVPMVEPAERAVLQRSMQDIPVSRYMDEFTALVRDHFREEHSTAYYAGRLCITPNYLNKIVQRSLGKSAKVYILEQLMAEACRLLRYTTLSVNEIADQLHFESTTYFVRLFHKYISQTPLEYRSKNMQSPEK